MYNIFLFTCTCNFVVFRGTLLAKKCDIKNKKVIKHHFGNIIYVQNVSNYLIIYE